MIISSVGTLLFVLLVILELSKLIFLSIFSLALFAVFPTFLCLTLGSWKFFNTNTFVVMTNKKVVLVKKKGVKQIPFSEIVHFESRTNWLRMNKEIVVKQKADKPFHATSISQQSGVLELFIDGLPATQRERVEQIMRERCSMGDSAL